MGEIQTVAEQKTTEKKLQKLAYKELRNLSNDQIAKLTSSRNGFVVTTDDITGARIVRFLRNEENFRSRATPLRNRIKYLRQAWVGFFLLDFMHLWVSSVNAGYEVRVIKTSPTSVEVEFRC